MVAPLVQTEMGCVGTGNLVLQLRGSVLLGGDTLFDAGAMLSEAGTGAGETEMLGVQGGVVAPGETAILGALGARYRFAPARKEAWRTGSGSHPSS